MLWFKFPLEAERIREVFCLAINSGHSVNAELSYELITTFRVKRCVCAVGLLVVIEPSSRPFTG